MKHTAYEETLLPRRIAHWIKTSRLATILLLALTLTNCKRTSSTTADPEPALPIDQRLAYCLIIQARVFALISLSPYAASDLKHVREETSRVLALLKVDPALARSKLPELYVEVVHINDAHEEYLRDVAQLSRSLKQRETADHDAALRKSLVDGGKEGALHKTEENDSWLEDTFKRALKSTVTGAQSYFEEEERLKQIREQDKEGKLAAYEKKFEHAKTDFTANTQALAVVLSSALKIPRSEFGLDRLLADAEVYRRRDLDQIAEVRRIGQKERPKDPIVAAALLLTSADKSKDSQSACVKLAEECYSLVDSIPGQSPLNYARYLVLTDAASILDTYLYDAHPFDGAWGAIRDEKALVAVSYREKAAGAYLDGTGEDEARLAWDYFLGGKFDQAITHAELANRNPMFQRDWAFCLKLAQLKSLVGKPGDSLTWLTTLVERFQYNDVDGLYSDSDLQALRSAKSEEFDALLDVKSSWDIEFGWMNDDIVLTNKSRFPITNVHFEPHIISGPNEWNLNLQTKRINPGETHKWEDALSVPGSKISSRSATISCDQIHAPLTTPTLPKIK